MGRLSKVDTSFVFEKRGASLNRPFVIELTCANSGREERCSFGIVSSKTGFGEVRDEGDEQEEASEKDRYAYGH